MLTDIQRAMLGDREAAERLTEQGVLLPCPWCNGDRKEKIIPQSDIGCSVLIAVQMGQLPPTNTKPALPGTPAHRF